ncbi:MAG: hypothetical protein JXA14_27435 [Anaerolineae bacterium]|nr:hypothetical protein [Anaerolineae bacterium]
MFNTVCAVMRTHIAASSVRELMHGHEEFVRACSHRLEETFGEWGIAFQNLVVNQYDIPQEYRDAVARVTMARYQRDTRLIDADAEAEAMLIHSRAEAEARLTVGSADVELMARMQAFGLDPIRLKAIEALSEYARLAAQSGSGGSSGGSEMVNMMMFMQMQRLMSDPGVPGEAKQFLSAQFPAVANQVQQLEAPADPQPPSEASVEPSQPLPSSQAEAVATDERTRIQRVLDNLDERLASGELSESTYERLYTKWENKLAELDG